jgi:hypothetical protein
MLKEIKNGTQSNEKNTVTNYVTFKVLLQHEAVWMTVISPFKNHMPLLPDIQYLPKGDRVHNDYTSLLKE